MGEKTAIEWCDSTWNPIRGCSRVSEGCRNCYAERVAARFSGSGQAYEGLATMTSAGPRWTGDVRLVEEHLTDPLKWKRPRKIFVNSMSDLFHENVKDEWIDKIFAVMGLATQHAFQVLTKRPERMMEYCKTLGQHHEKDRVSLAAKSLNVEKGFFYSLRSGGWRIPNVMLGVSVEDQKTADERIPLLLETPAATRFISYEPALGPVDFTRIKTGSPFHGNVDVMSGYLCGEEPDEIYDYEADPQGWIRKPAGEWERGEHGVDWLIAGGESGPGARPAHPDWFRSARDQCQAAGVAFFFKQWGEWARWEPGATGQILHISARDGKTGTNPGYVDTKPYSDSIRSDTTPMARVGKKAAGRLLDGREWNEMPEVKEL